MTWDNSEREIQQDSGHRSQMRTAVVLSLLLHGMVLAVSLLLMDHRSQKQQALAPVTVSINLLPPAQEPEQQLRVSEPVRVEQEGQTAADQLPLHEVGEEAVSESGQSANISDVESAPLVEVPQLAESPVSPRDVEVDSGSVPVPAPDGLTLRQTVRAIHEQQQSDAAVSHCTPAQRRNELIDCLDNQRPDYAESLRSPIYLSFDQPRADDQSRRAMGTIGGNQQQLRAGIQAASLDGLTSDYVLEELSQGIEIYSGTGNTRLERLTEQILHDDPVHQQATRIMNPR